MKNKPTTSATGTQGVHKGQKNDSFISPPLVVLALMILLTIIFSSLSGKAQPISQSFYAWANGSSNNFCTSDTINFSYNGSSENYTNGDVVSLNFIYGDGNNQV